MRTEGSYCVTLWVYPVRQLLTLPKNEGDEKGVGAEPFLIEKLEGAFAD